LDAVHFHFQDHCEVFVAMKTLLDDGVHVDQAAVQKKMGAAWSDSMKDIFDASKADAFAASECKRRVILRANIEHARGIGRSYMKALDKADEDNADLPALLSDLQKAVFNQGRIDSITPPVRSEADLTDQFLLDLENPKPGLKTGFDDLDKIIKGLKPGLFIIAAPPSAGKTTYVKQLADQVAELNEVPVLFFSYEQSADELRTKSLSRISKAIGYRVQNERLKEGKDFDNVRRAADAYKKFAMWIKIIEGDRHNTVESIRALAQREKVQTGKAPVLVIDYLQILPVDDSGQDKRTSVDLVVSELRRISRDIGSHVIAISSMGRASYAAVTMSGFKESGGIEYGADIAAILSVDSESDGADRKVTLNIIKNRNGRRGKVGMKYDMTHDHFEETDSQPLSYTDTFGGD
jgi:replicative DNA helicase